MRNPIFCEAVRDSNVSYILEQIDQQKHKSKNRFNLTDKKSAVKIRRAVPKPEFEDAVGGQLEPPQKQVH